VNKTKQGTQSRSGRRRSPRASRASADVPFTRQTLREAVLYLLQLTVESEAGSAVPLEPREALARAVRTLLVHRDKRKSISDGVRFLYIIREGERLFRSHGATEPAVEQLVRTAAAYSFPLSVAEAQAALAAAAGRPRKQTIEAALMRHIKPETEMSRRTREGRKMVMEGRTSAARGALKKRSEAWQALVDAPPAPNEVESLVMALARGADLFLHGRLRAPPVNRGRHEPA